MCNYLIMEIVEDDMVEKYFIIRNTITKEVWNNVWGWVDHEDSDCTGLALYTESETKEHNLPIDGEWEEA
jgi:hypothetical protein